MHVCFNGINYQSCLARTTNLSNSSWLQFPTSFSNTVNKYFLGISTSSIYLLGQLPMLPLMDDIATRWEGQSHCLAHYTIHFWQIVNVNSKFPQSVGCLDSEYPPDSGVTHLVIYRFNEQKLIAV